MSFLYGAQSLSFILIASIFSQCAGSLPTSEENAKPTGIQNATVGEVYPRCFGHSVWMTDHYVRSHCDYLSLQMAAEAVRWGDTPIEFLAPYTQAQAPALYHYPTPWRMISGRSSISWSVCFMISCTGGLWPNISRLS